MTQICKGTGKLETTVGRQWLLQAATSFEKRAAHRCPVWPVVVVVVLEAGAGSGRGVYFAEGDNNLHLTCVQSTLANELRLCVHTRI